MKLKIILQVALCIWLGSSYADEPKWTNWKTFKSNLGFSFEYPREIQPAIEDIEIPEGTPVENSSKVFLQVGPYKTNAYDTIKNYVSIDYFGKNGDAKERKSFEKLSEEKRKDSLVYSGSSKNQISFSYIEHLHSGRLRWKKVLWCAKDKKILFITGPEAAEGDSGHRLAVDKSKQKTLYTPEPFKRIINSIKCP